MYNPAVSPYNIQNVLAKDIRSLSAAEESFWWCRIMNTPYTNFSLIKQRLAYSKNPNFFDSGSGESLLHLAIRAGKINIVGYLIAKGANPNIASKQPSPYYVELTRDDREERWHTRPGDTPLHTACRWSRSKIIALLLQKDAHPNITNSANETPLEVLVLLRPYTQQLPSMRLLLEAGANAQTVQDYYEFFLQRHLQEARQLSPLLTVSGFYWSASAAAPLKEELKSMHHHAICLLKEKLSCKAVYIGILRALPRTLYFLKQLAGPYPQLVKHATLKEKIQYQQDMMHFDDRLHPTLKQRQEYASTHAYEKAIRHFLYIRHVEGAVRSSCLKSLGSMPHEILLQIKEHLMDQTFGALLSAPYQISREEALLLFKACQQNFSFWNHFNTERLEHDWRTPWPNHDDSFPSPR